MKNEDEDEFFWVEAKKNEYIRTSTNEGTKKPEYLYLNHQRNEEKLIHPSFNYQRDKE